ncbi:MAG: NAD(P)H-binding protein, partial [Hyphomicrobium sp.]
MNVLVLGAYGLIGHEISAHLLRNGHSVVGLARDAAHGQALLPAARWVSADIARLVTPDAWSEHLTGIDAVINASGALQSGARDNVKAVQLDAIVALVTACEQRGVAKFIQISAPGADPSAATEFMRTKGIADDALRASRLDWVILKPGLVIAPAAYGGTSLLRALAAVPIVQPVVLPRARIQTVDVADVAHAVARALTNPALIRQSFDLVEPTSATLQDIVLKFRRWLGLAAPRAVFEIPKPLAALLAKLADATGLLGWRSPMRTTALTVLAADVVADPSPWQRATGETLKSLDETLARLPSTRQERSFARMELAFPILVAVFALFW